MKLIGAFDEVNLATTKTDAENFGDVEAACTRGEPTDTWWGEKIASLSLCPVLSGQMLCPVTRRGGSGEAAPALWTRMGADEVFSSLTVDTVTVCL